MLFHAILHAQGNGGYYRRILITVGTVATVFRSRSNGSHLGGMTLVGQIQRFGSCHVTPEK